MIIFPFFIVCWFLLFFQRLFNVCNACPWFSIDFQIFSFFLVSHSLFNSFQYFAPRPPAPFRKQKEEELFKKTRMLRMRALGHGDRPRRLQKVINRQDRNRKKSHRVRTQIEDPTRHLYLCNGFFCSSKWKAGWVERSTPKHRHRCRNP